MKPSQLNEFLHMAINAGEPVLIKGAPGTGKTDIIKETAKATGARLIIEHPVVSDPTDYKGLPFAVEGKADFLPFGSLREIIDATEKTIFFLDDLGQAPVSVQAACMQLLLARRINGHYVSDQVVFIAATNDHTHKAGVTGLLEPVKSRFITILELNVDLQDWTAWALKNNMPTELIAFIRFKPELLHDFKPTNEIKNTPSPRTVASCGRLMMMGIPEHLALEVYTGAAGEQFAIDFVNFCKMAKQLPDPQYVLMNPDVADVPKEPGILYALCGALSRATGEVSFPAFCRYIRRMPPEFSVLSMRDCLLQKPDLTATREFIAWQSDYKEVLV